jgi:glyoxylase-like metal-dependent hydrolase (beta-lactamase superfamily II)
MAALVLEPLQGRTFVLRGPANVGVFVPGDSQAVLVDAGNDEDAGRKILQACKGAGLGVACIANTHSNADHCGGNAFIQARTSCRIAATRAEAAFIELPILEPSYLWGGFPVASLRNKFLMAKPSRVTDVIEPAGPVPGTELEAVPLPGHFFGMVGFMTPDRVFFAADAVAGEEILSKYHVFYYHDLAAQLETLDVLARLDADWVVPSHAAPTRDIRPLVAANRAKILEIAAFLVDAVAQPTSLDDLLARLCEHYGIVLNAAQYVLIGSTLRSYVAWLEGCGAISVRFEPSRMWIVRN